MECSGRLEVDVPLTGAASKLEKNFYPTFHTQFKRQVPLPAISRQNVSRDLQSFRGCVGPRLL
jgi:hypothetical protein